MVGSDAVDAVGSVIMGIIVKEIVAGRELPAQWRQQLGIGDRPDQVVKVTLELVDGPLIPAPARPRSEKILAGIRRTKGQRLAVDILREDRRERDGRGSK